MAEFTDFVVIDGHRVPSSRVDLFFSGKDGERVSNQDYDISKARQEAAEALGDDVITWDVL